MLIKDKLILALDTSDFDKAFHLVDSLKDYFGCFKIGLELFVSHGRRGFDFSRLGVPIFLDLKLHDIPETVRKTVSVICERQDIIKYFTVHASGGEEMLRVVAQEVASKTAGAVTPLAVTVLTSSLDPNNETHRLAKLAESCGVAGVVCSPQNLKEIKQQTKLIAITPGIRGAYDALNDQKRTLSYKEALDLGSNGLVIGRAVTQAKDPIAAVEDILKEINY